MEQPDLRNPNAGNEFDRPHGFRSFPAYVPDNMLRCSERDSSFAGGVMAMPVVICYGKRMAQEKSNSNLAGTAGPLLSVVGILTYFSGVFGFTPRLFVFAGAALIVLSWVAYAVEEFAPVV